jgi:cytochrome c2
MDAFEWNKIAGAVLGTLLVTFGLSIFSEILFETEVPESPGYVIAVAEETGAEGETGGEEAAQPIGVLMASADPAQGEASAKKCGACHTFAEGEPHKIGPNLWDVVNRPIAGAAGYEYSPDMQAYAQQAQTWSFEHLSAFLQNPKGVVPGTKMAFAGLKNDPERANIIAYLRSLSANPAPLPAPEAEAAEAAPGGGEAAHAAAAPAEGQQQAAAEQGAVQSSGAAQAAAEDTGDSGGADDQAAQPQGSLGAIDAVPADQQGAVPQVPAVEQPAPEPQAAEAPAAQSGEPAPAAAGQTTDAQAAAPAEAAAPRPEPPPASDAAPAGQAQQSTADGTQPAPTPPPATAQAPTAEQQTAQAEQPAASPAGEAQPAAPAAAGATASGLAAEVAAADPTAGEAFARRCAACHSMEQGGANKVGPNIWSVVDRPVASVPDYAYSDAMVAFSEGGAKRWDIDTLHAYLANPKEVVPGTKMVFPGIRNAADLANVIAYLRTLSESPPPQ